MKIIILDSGVYTDGIYRAMQYLGHEVIKFKTTDFYWSCSYWKRKLYKVGVTSLRDNYIKAWQELLYDRCLSFKPQVIIILSGYGMLDNVLLDKISDLDIKMVCWFADGVGENIENKDYFLLYDKVVFFEKSDLLLYKNICKNAVFSHLGYDAENFYPKDDFSKDIDISFVGNARADRIDILNEVAKYAIGKKKKLWIQGKYWDERHFWKKYQFRLKYPVLFKCIHSGVIGFNNVANIYRRSKICLNLHIPQHKSLNPRTFEVLGTKSFLLMNSGQDYDGYLCENKDFTQFYDMDDLIEKIDYYLENEDKRNAIARNGYEAVRNKYSMSKIAKEILSNL